MKINKKNIFKKKNVYRALFAINTSIQLWWLVNWHSSKCQKDEDCKYWIERVGFHSGIFEILQTSLIFFTNKKEVSEIFSYIVITSHIYDILINTFSNKLNLLVFHYLFQITLIYCYGKFANNFFYFINII